MHFSKTDHKNSSRSINAATLLSHRLVVWRGWVGEMVTMTPRYLNRWMDEWMDVLIDGWLVCWLAGWWDGWFQGLFVGSLFGSLFTYSCRCCCCCCCCGCSRKENKRKSEMCKHLQQCNISDVVVMSFVLLPHTSNNGRTHAHGSFTWLLLLLTGSFVIKRNFLQQHILLKVSRSLGRSVVLFSWHQVATATNKQPRAIRGQGVVIPAVGNHSD